MKISSPIPFILVFLLFQGLAAGADGEPGEGTVVSELAKVEVFAFGGIGFAGTTSQGETLYRQILERDHAEAIFIKVFETGNNQAKAYALCGLHALKSERYGELRDAFAAQEVEVNRMSGCNMFKATPAESIASFEKRG